MAYYRSGQPARFGWLGDVFIVLCVVAVAVLGGLVSGGDADPWYQSLNKPEYNPPGIAFAIVWPTLYTLMALSAIIVRRTVGYFEDAPTTFGLFLLQLGFNLAWSVLFFFFHRPVWSMIDLVGLWFAIVALILHTARYSAIATLLLLPYLAWVSFAGYLNWSIIQLNP